MASVGRRSVWVSGLNSPIPSQDLTKYFSRVADVEEVVVPNLQGTEALIVFQSPDAIDEALKYSGRPFRDIAIVVSRPTPEQLSLCYDKPIEVKQKFSEESLPELRKSLQGMSDSAIKSMMKELTMIAKKRLSLYEAASDDDRSEHASDANIGHNDAHTDTRTMSQQMFVPAMQYPRITFFSGELGKSEHATFFQWRNEVRCLMAEGHPRPHVMQAIRRSLKGTAAEVLLNLGEQASPHDVLQKFDVIFGNALSSEALMEDFYTAHQKENEEVVVWGCRLESLLTQAKDKGIISDGSSEMLRSKFWSGIQNKMVKNAIRHRFDAGESFQQLLVAARAVEHELKDSGTEKSIVLPTNKGKVSGKVQVLAVEDNKLDKLLKTMEDMTQRLKKRETQSSRATKPKPRHQPVSQTSDIECFYCHEQGHFIRDCQKLQRKNQRGNAQ